MSTLNKRQNSGHILIEVILAMALFAIIASAILGGFVSAREGKVNQEQALVAKGYMDQAVEAVRSVRERDWLLIPTSGTYYPKLSDTDGATWTLVLDPLGESIDGFTRRIVFSEISRDPQPTSPTFGDTVLTDGGFDLASRKAVITVSWGPLISQSVTSTVFLTRRENNTNFEQTLYGDFKDGFKLGTLVKCGNEDCGSDGEDAEVVLEPGGYGNWCNPSQKVTAVNLQRQGVPTTVFAYEIVENDEHKYNEVFAGTGGNASGTPFTNTKITADCTDPLNCDIDASPLGDLNVTPSQKANAVFGDKDGYAYIATSKRDQAMMILDLSEFKSTTPPPPIYDEPVGYFKIDESNKDANSVFVETEEGRTDNAYLTDDHIYFINIENKSSPSRRTTEKLALDGTGTKVIVSKDSAGDYYAYVAIADPTANNAKLQIFDVSNPNNPVKKGELKSSSIPNVRDVVVNTRGTRAYIVTDISSTQPEFYTVDITNKNAPTLLKIDADHDGIKEKEVGKYNADINARGIALVANETIAVVVGKDGSDDHPEYQVLSIWNESDPDLCKTGGSGTLRVSSGIYAISPVYQKDGHAYSYVVTGDTAAELKIIEGGNGGGGGGGGFNGIFESQIKDFPNPVQFNRFDVNADTADGYYNLWVASYDPVGGSCNLDETGGNYVYVGADGSEFPESAFTSSGPIPFSSDVTGYKNPARCFRYKLMLFSTTPGGTPLFNDIKVNYSP